MQAQRNDRRGNSTLVIVAAFIAVVGQAVVLFNDFGAGNNLHNSVSARMITAAALSRAGAIEIWPKPAAGGGNQTEPGEMMFVTPRNF
jgi:hypothetical protein